MPAVLIDDATPDDVLFPPGMRHGCVPRDYDVQPEEMFAPPSEIPLIPRSEWDARIEEQERTKSSLEHVWNRSGQLCLDQNGQGFCATADTEVLTDGGFVPWPDYNWTDLLGTVNQTTGMLEFQSPLHKHVYEYKGEMVYSTNRRIDFGMTPDHRMLVRKWDEANRTLSDSYTFQKAGELGWYVGLMAAPKGYVGTELVEVEVGGDRRYDGDDFFAMISLIASDGYAGGADSTKNWVSFCCFHEGRYPMVAALAARIGFAESPSRKGVWTRYSAGALAEWVRANCYTGGLGATNKRIPDLVKCASTRQIKHFLMFFGDQTHGNPESPQFTSTSRRMIDDLQELHLRIGKRSTVGSRSPRSSTVKSGGNVGQVIVGGHTEYCLTVAGTERLCLDKKKHIEQDKYNGLVYCATVPNGTLVTRRNGTVLISGNCWAYSTAHAIMLSRMAANLPLVRLSGHAVACKIKGFKDEGGWCGLSAKFARETGYPSVSEWPQDSMSRAFDNPATWEDAARHKITEDFVDLARPVWGQNLTFDQLVTCLLLNRPCPTDWAFWSHSVCAVRPVRIEPGSYGVRILNQWYDAPAKPWGENGFGTIRETAKITSMMGALCIRGTTASAT